jgi:hypothetical protein
MNVALYVRISTADQNASMQEDELRAYCEKRALMVVGEYQDAMSGAKDSRPDKIAGWQRARPLAERAKLPTIQYFPSDQWPQE